MDRHADEAGGCFFVAWTIVVAFLTAMLVWYMVSSAHRQEAIDHGAAEYVMDPATGETEWRWKETAKEGSDAQ